MKSMSKHFFLFTFLVISIFSCKSKDGLMSYEEVQQNPHLNQLKEQGLVTELKIVDKLDISEFDTSSINLANVRHKGHAMVVELSYGGGCVEPHVFELVTDGSMDSERNVKMWLLHKTHDDKCKKLITQQLTFDVSPLETLKLKRVKSFNVNNQISEIFE